MEIHFQQLVYTFFSLSFTWLAPKEYSLLFLFVCFGVLSENLISFGWEINPRNTSCCYFDSLNKSWPVCVAIAGRSQTQEQQQQQENKTNNNTYITKISKKSHKECRKESCVTTFFSSSKYGCSCSPLLDTYDLRCISQWFIVNFRPFFYFRWGGELACFST